MSDALTFKCAKCGRQAETPMCDRCWTICQDPPPHFQCAGCKKCFPPPAREAARCELKDRVVPFSEWHRDPERVLLCATCADTPEIREAALRVPDPNDMPEFHATVPDRCTGIRYGDLWLTKVSFETVPGYERPLIWSMKFAPGPHDRFRAFGWDGDAEFLKNPKHNADYVAGLVLRQFPGGRLVAQISEAWGKVVLKDL